MNTIIFAVKIATLKTKHPKNMLAVFIITLFVLTVSSDNAEPHFSLIGDALEGGSVCENGILFVDRYIGLQPSKENYFNGTFNLDQYKNLTEARVELRLRAPATLTLKEEDGKVSASGNTFYIEFFKQHDGKYRTNFHVQGRPKGDFPYVDDIFLNGINVCPEKTDWKPSILGATDAVSNNLNDSNGSDSIPKNVCGVRRPKIEEHITHGYEAEEGAWPWHAAIFRINEKSSIYNCGGTLVSSKAVITAAHCITENQNSLDPERVLVKLGLHNRTLASANTQEYQVSKIIAHEEYNSTNLRNDIALLILKTEVTLTDYVQPACLWDRSNVGLDEVIDEPGHVIGWGFNEHDKLSDILSQATMPVVSLLTCLESNRPFFGNYLTDMNYCAGFRNGTSVCNADSGGGMFFLRGEIYKLRGLVSLSVSRDDNNICDTRHFVLFTDVAKYLDWIDKNLDS